MDSSFDKLIKSSLNKKFDIINTPNIIEELAIIKFMTKQRIRIIRIKTFSSICAALLIIPFVLYIYLNNIPNHAAFPIKYQTVDKTRAELVLESKLIVYGEVKNITKDTFNKQVEIQIREVLKGSHKESFVTVISNDNIFKVGEIVILLLTKDNDKNNYLLPGGIQAKYVLKDSEKYIFENFNFSDEIDLRKFKKELKK